MNIKNVLLTSDQYWPIKVFFLIIDLMFLTSYLTSRFLNKFIFNF